MKWKCTYKEITDKISQLAIIHGHLFTFWDSVMNRTCKLDEIHQKVFGQCSWYFIFCLHLLLCRKWLLHLSIDWYNEHILWILQERPKWMKISSLDELKTKVGHVIVMILLVKMFERSKMVTIATGMDLLSYSICIFLSSASLYILHNLHKSE